MSNERAAERPRDIKPAANPRHELVRDQLIDIAAKLFDTKGYAQTSMNDIAQALGLGRSAIYHYFKNKEEIVTVLVEAEALTPSYQLRELMAIPGLRPSQRLHRAVVDGIERRLSSGSRFLLLSRLEAQIPDDLNPLYNQGRRDIYDFYVRCISDGIESGEFRATDPKIAAFAVIGMANWTSRWYSPSGSKSPREIAEVIADLALASLRTAAAGEPHDTQAARQLIADLRKQLTDLEGLLK